MRRCLLPLAIIAGLYAGLLAQPVAAADYQQILSVKVYRNVVATGDRIFLVHYDIHYDTLPSTELAKYYTFRLYDSTGALIGTAQPFGYFHSGYDQGIFGFYFGSVGAPAWDDAAMLTVQGSPAYMSAPFPAVNYGVSVSDYCTATDQATNQAQLASQIIVIARSLEIDWTVQLLTTVGTRTTLNDAGVTYFSRSISGIQYMAPTAFAVSANAPNTTGRAWTDTKATSYDQRYTGTWVATAMTAAGSLFNVEGNLVSGAVILILCTIVVGLCAKKWQNADAGMAASFIIFLVASLGGFVAWAIVGIATVLAALYVAMRVIWRHGT